MIYKKYFSLCVLFFLSLSLFAFEYDNAAYSAQQGSWEQVYEKLQSVLVDNPDRADVLYDAGVAAYNLEKFSEAVACFSRSSDHSTSVDLKKRALFNAGNSCVACDQLEQALKQYDLALLIDSQDEYVKHNRDIVEQMLQQKKEQQNNKDQKSKKDQHEKDQQKNEHEKRDNKENQENKENQNSQQDQKKEQSGTEKQDDQQGKDQQSEGQQSDLSDQGSDKKSQDKKGSNGSDGSDRSKRTDERDAKQDRANDRQNEQRNGNEKSENKLDNEQDERNGQQGDQHDRTPQEQKNDSDKTNDASVASQENKDQGGEHDSSAAAEQGEEEMARAADQKINDPLLIKVLQQQEDRDKAMNKQLMQAKIRQNGGKNGQNSW